MKEPMPTLKIRIEVEVKASEGSDFPMLVNDALEELFHRRDFKMGFLKQGRVLEHLSDFSDAKVTVDYFTQRVPG